ncbi:MAG: 1-acyl-sn-glycerol-3-phosphate acyltransferase, partial [Actinomycetes bacterium]
MRERVIAVDPPGSPHSGGGRGVYWLLKNVVLGPGINKIFRPVVDGAENVPRRGAAILASNHLSFADWLFMPLALDRR